jgi:hypothetical protein
MARPIVYSSGSNGGLTIYFGRAVGGAGIAWR